MRSIAFRQLFEFGFGVYTRINGTAVMAQAVVLAPLDRDFAKEVSVLAKEGQKLIDGYASLTLQMLVFAQDFKRLWDRAAKLDGAETGKHHNHLRQAVSELIQTSNKSIRSRWITIGSQAKKLMHYKDALPPYRDSLYEVALALQDEKPVTKWVNAKQITVDSSVREVRSLRGSKKRTRKASNPSIKVRRSYPAKISISFETYSAAAETLSTILLSGTADFRITAHQAFDAALRERLDDKDYQKAKSRIG
jgi:hypothetical protein